MSFNFNIEKSGKARAGVLSVNEVDIPTPVFMPVGTNASVKALTPKMVEESGSKIILANAYHLALRPGVDLIEKMGGVKKFSSFNGAMLTDSGGYQVFSLAKLNKITDEGVEFQSHIDGSRMFFTPKIATANQHKIGADLIMAFDECAHHDSSYDYAKEAVCRTTRWAKECIDYHNEYAKNQYLGGIVQGALYKDLRLKSASELIEMDFPFYAIGGLSVGEGHEKMMECLSYTAEALPKEKPRYLMGVGEVSDIIGAVSLGVDMFDCVMPTRNARNGEAFSFSGTLRLRNSEYIEDERPIEEECDCYTCQNFSRAYLRHLYNAKEILFSTLVSLHNITFMRRLMDKLRQAIIEDNFSKVSKEIMSSFYG